MNELVIPGQYNKPGIILNKTQNRFEFAGNSFPDDPISFYNPVEKWVSGYVESPNKHTKLVFKMEYFNTASTVYFMNIFNLFRKVLHKNCSLSVAWYYNYDDKPIYDIGNMYHELTNIPFDFISVED